MTKPATSLSSSTTSTRIALLLRLLVGTAADRDGDVDGRVAAADGQTRGAARRDRGHGADEALCRVDFLAVDGGDDVAGLQAGAGGGAAAVDGGDGDAVVAAGVLHRHAQPPAL